MPYYLTLPSGLTLPADGAKVALTTACELHRDDSAVPNALAVVNGEYRVAVLSDFTLETAAAPAWTDSFTYSNGELATASGGRWTKLVGGTGQADVINASQVRLTAQSGTNFVELAYIFNDPTVTPNYARAEFVSFSSTTSFGGPGLYLSDAGSGLNGYLGGYHTGNGWQITRFTNGATTTLINSATSAPASGTIFQLRDTGSGIFVLEVDTGGGFSTVLTTSADTNHTTGAAGLVIESSAARNMVFDNFEAGTQ